MIVYLDTSVILSRFLGENNALSSWGNWEKSFTSLLTRVEFLRTIDRMRLEGRIDDPERVALHQQFYLLWEAMYRIPISSPILGRAADPGAGQPRDGGPAL